MQPYRTATPATAAADFKTCSTLLSVNNNSLNERFRRTMTAALNRRLRLESKELRKAANKLRKQSKETFKQSEKLLEMVAKLEGKPGKKSK